MAAETAKLDRNRNPAVLGVTDDVSLEVRNLRVDPSTNELKVQTSGTVTVTGVATEATLSALNAKFGSLGQKTMAGSAPVVLASDQSTLNTLEATPTTVGAAQATVTTAGTEVQLGTNTCLSVTVKAKSTNTGLIFVGGDNTVSSTTGFILSAGEAISYAVSNTNKVWVDSSVNGEGVSYTWVV